MADAACRVGGTRDYGCRDRQAFSLGKRRLHWLTSASRYDHDRMGFQMLRADGELTRGTSRNNTDTDNEWAFGDIWRAVNRHWMDRGWLTLCVNLLLCLWWLHMTSHARVDALVYCRVQQKQHKPGIRSNRRRGTSLKFATIQCRHNPI